MRQKLTLKDLIVLEILEDPILYGLLRKQLRLAGEFELLDELDKLKDSKPSPK